MQCPAGECPAGDIVDHGSIILTEIYLDRELYQLVFSIGGRPDSFLVDYIV